MKPHDMGVLFDECAEHGVATTTHLDRPFDLAPDGGTRYDVPALAGLVRECAGWLAAAGVRRGDRVAVVKDNHWDYDLLACAAIRLGAVPALLAGHLPAETVALLLERLDPALLVTTGKHLARGGTEPARRVLTLDEGPDGVLTLDDVRGHHPPPPRRRSDDEPLVINHTSGTTGVPKLVSHSTETIINRLARFEAVRWPVLGVRVDDVVASASNFAHGRTFCWTASVYCLAPEKVLIVGSGDGAALLDGHPPTVLEALPDWYVRHRPLARTPDNPFRRVRLFAGTYDAVHPPTVRTYLDASRHDHPLWMQGWGQTETGPLTFRFLTRRAARRARGGHDLGRPLPGRARLRVVDPTTFAPLPPGRTGLVLARTRARCLGYVGEAERFAAKDTGGWWNTGDLGSRTRTGAVVFADREVDGCPDLSCVGTEDVLEERLPQAMEVVLLPSVGRPPIPVVVTPDGRLAEADWRRAAHGLPTMADPVPMTWDDIPRTGTGKVRRQELLARLAGAVERHGSGRWT